MSPVSDIQTELDGSAAALRETMDRVGASVTPEAFVSAVVQTFVKINDTPEDVIRNRFRQTRSFEDFQSLLREAAVTPSTRILAVGCESGFAGRRSGYAEDVIRTIYCPGKVEVDRLEVSPCLLRHWREHAGNYPRYRLVVSHSLLHFIHYLKSFCDLIQSLIVPGGEYLMANEPNARFWKNPECLQALKTMDEAEHRHNRLRRAFNPQRYISKALTAIRGKKADFETRINRELKTVLGLRGELTLKEVERIADPYLPDPQTGGFSFGADGFDPQDLEATLLSGLKARSVRSSGYLRRDNIAAIPPLWRRLDQQLAARYPKDGVSLSILWWKPAA
jgi:hypothetical protein